MAISDEIAIFPTNIMTRLSHFLPARRRGQGLFGVLSFCKYLFLAFVCVLGNCTIYKCCVTMFCDVDMNIIEMANDVENNIRDKPIGIWFGGRFTM